MNGIIVLKQCDVVILTLLCEGLTSLEIASKLNWSDSTVKRRIGKMMTVFGARNRVALVADALRQGIIR